MNTSSTQITRLVRRYQSEHDLTTTALATQIHMTRSTLRDRLIGRCRWQIEDLDRLRDAGILEWDVEWNVEAAL